MNLEAILRRAVLVGIFCIPVIPLIVANFFFFPYITGKNFAFRIIVEVIFGAWLLLALRDPAYRPRFSWILAAAGAFLLAVGAADIVSENPFKSFWSNFERMEGFVTILHLFLYVVVAGTMLSAKKLWGAFANTSIGVGTIIALYGLVQYLGWLPTKQGDRPEATLGNATYLAGYLLFHVFIAALLFANAQGRKTAQWLYGAIGIFFAFMVYTTATRGAAIGMLAGVLITALLLLFFSRGERHVQRAALGILIGVIALVGLVVALRNTSFIQNDHVLGRLTSISLEGGKSRFLVWNMAWQGFKERPILGWGQESFNFVFNKYYDPRMYDQESWFDRVHNVYFDWLIAAGLIGLLAYLSLYGGALYYIFRRSSPLLNMERAMLAGLLGGYAIYNLFVFDNIANYLLFFSLLAYLHARGTEGRAPLIPQWKPKAEILDRIIAPIVVIAILFALYAVNAKGILTANDLVRALGAQSEGLSKNLVYFKQALARDSFGMQEVREQLVNVGNRIAAAPLEPALKQELSTLAAAEMQKQIDEVPGDARFYLFMASLLDTYQQYPAAVPYLEKALEFSPRKQITLFEIGTNLINQGKSTEGLAAFKTAFELEPSFKDARIIYAVGALYAGEDRLAETLLAEKFGDAVVPDRRLAQAYIRRQEFKKAVPILEKILEASQNDWQLHVTLGMVYVQVNKRTQAVAELEKAIELNGQFKQQGEFFIGEVKAGRNPFI